MRTDRITRKEARVLAAAEFEKFAALAASLTPAEWATDTACVGWDVRKMVLHVLGSAEAQASPRVFLHQLRRGIPLNKQRVTPLGRRPERAADPGALGPNRHRGRRTAP